MALCEVLEALKDGSEVRGPNDTFLYACFWFHDFMLVIFKYMQYVCVKISLSSTHFNDAGTVSFGGPTEVCSVQGIGY